MKKETKDFILDIRDRMFKSNIKDACMNFMQLHPGMFKDTTDAKRKIMSINMSVCICCAEADIGKDPGFITIDVDAENIYSEHFDSGNVYWNNKTEEKSNVQD